MRPAHRGAFTLTSVGIRVAAGALLCLGFGACSSPTDERHFIQLTYHASEARTLQVHAQLRGQGSERVLWEAELTTWEEGDVVAVVVGTGTTDVGRVLFEQSAARALAEACELLAAPTITLMGYVGDARYSACVGADAPFEGDEGAEFGAELQRFSDEVLLDVATHGDSLVPCGPGVAWWECF